MLFTPARKIAGAAAAALLAGALAAVAPATAVSPTLDYTCDAPGGPYTFKVVADTTLPETATPGQALTGTATYTVTIPDALRNLIYSATNSRFVEGTAAIKATALGAPASLTGSIPKTAIPASGDFQVVATGPVAATAPTASGPATIVAGDFDTAVKLTKQDGTPGDLVSETTIKCVLKAGQNAVVDTVTVAGGTTPTTPTTPVVKVATTTTVKAKFAATKKTITSIVKVKAADGTKGAGKVKVTLKLGNKKIKTIRATLATNGVAKAVFKKVTKKGKYKIDAVYAGSATQNGSKGRTTLKVA